MPSFEEHIKKHLPDAKTITIGNAIPQFNFSSDLSADKEIYKIIFVGRLNKNHKRPHLLIEAFAEICNDYPNWVVELWGAIDNKAYYIELKNLIKIKNLQDRVFLKGPTNEIPEKLREADIYAIPSAYEGFCLALGEGMSVGLPSVGYLSAPSVNEVIRNGENGLLTEEGVKPYAAALEKLMKNKNLRIKMGAAAKSDMAEYAPQKIWDKWEKLLKEYNKNG